MKLDVKEHTTWLKQCLLTHFTDMHAQKKGRVVLITFEEDIGTPLVKACDLDSANDILHLACAAKIVHNHMFRKAKSFTGLSERICTTLVACISKYDT